MKAKWIGLGLLGLFLLGWFAWPEHTPPGLTADDWPRLLRHWHAGEVILLIRHAERCDRSDAPCLDGEKGITVRGAKRAAELGQALAEHLDLKLAQRYHSPVKRTAQTALALFGTTSQAAPWLRKKCKTQLADALRSHKKPGTNLVGVTHATCMAPLRDRNGKPLIAKSTLNDDSYGIAWFLVLDTSGDLQPLGYLLPNDWQRLPTSAAHPSSNRPPLEPKPNQ